MDSFESEIMIKEKNVVPVLTNDYQELIDIDGQLNKCMYYTVLVPNKNDQEEFVRLYNNISITEGVQLLAKGKFFDVIFYARLMLKDKKGKITPTKLENSVLVIAVPIGETSNGEINYYFTEYKITKEDKNALSIKSKGKLKSTATNEERYDYFEDLVIDYVKEVRKGLSDVSSLSLLPIAKEKNNWMDFEAKFIKKYDYVPDKFESTTWNKYDVVRFDARTIDSENHIIPIVVEYYNSRVDEVNSINYDNEIIDDAELIKDFEEVENSDYVDDDYSLGENTYVNADADNKFIKSTPEEETEDLQKNKFINEYNSKYFKLDIVLDDDEKIKDDIVPLSFKENIKSENENNKTKFKSIKKYKLTSGIPFKKNKEIIEKKDVSQSFDEMKNKPDNTKKSIYKLSSVHKFSDTKEEKTNVVRKKSVPFSVGIEV